MSAIALMGREAGYAGRTLVRDAQALFFTAGLPLLYLLVFAGFFGDQSGRVPGQPGLLEVPTIMTASVIVIGVVSAAFQNLTITLVQDREWGVLKRLRSTPVSTSVFIGGHLLNALVVSLLLALLVAALGFTVYDVPLPGQRSLAAVVTVVVGAVACCCVAFPFTVLIRKSTGAVPMTVAVTLTLFFISGNFFPGSEAPTLIKAIADFFPVSHFFQAMLTAINPHVSGWAFQWRDLGVLALWAAAGMVLGVRFFRWTPTGERD
jgi:ABC-2 type transport system permease protein